jgi:hypothetical protein
MSNFIKEYNFDFVVDDQCVDNIITEKCNPEEILDIFLTGREWSEKLSEQQIENSFVDLIDVKEKRI